MENIITNAKTLIRWNDFVNPELADIGWLVIAFILFVSLLASLFISYLYIYFYGRTSTGSQIHRAFPMLGLSITGIFISIQFSLPLSLGLLGALSIIRFRTPIKEPEEIGFIMLVIAASLGCATFNLYFLVTFLCIAIIGLLILRVVPNFHNVHIQSGLIMVNMPRKIYELHHQAINALIKEYMPNNKQQSVVLSAETAMSNFEIKQTKGVQQDQLALAIGEIDRNIEVKVYINDSRITAY
ncbi:MAG: hypothetical protein ACI9PZ_001793 [Parvicella sp.]|jgi:hypothetical protein